MSAENEDEYENVPDFAPNKQAENSQQSSQGSDSSQSQDSPPKKELSKPISSLNFQCGLTFFKFLYFLNILLSETGLFSIRNFSWAMFWSQYCL